MRTYLIRVVWKSTRKGVGTVSSGCGLVDLWGGMGVIDVVFSELVYPIWADLPVGNPFFWGRQSSGENLDDH